MNIGCGPSPPKDWTNIDLKDYGQATVGMPRGKVGDLALGMPWPDHIFDYAVSHHAVQMIPYTSIKRAFREVRRLLRPGGVWRISVPDPLAAMAMWEAGDIGWFPIVDAGERFSGGKLMAYLTWYSEARSLFTRAWLSELLMRHGFAQVSVVCCDWTIYGPDGPDGITALDSRPYESIYVEART